MCNLYSETKGQAAIRGLFRVQQDRIGYLDDVRGGRSLAGRRNVRCAEVAAPLAGRVSADRRQGREGGSAAVLHDDRFVTLRGVWSQTGQRTVAGLSAYPRRGERDNAEMPRFSANNLRALADSCATLQGRLDVLADARG